MMIGAENSNSGDPRAKYTGSVHGNRSSHEASPSKQQTQYGTINPTDPQQQLSIEANQLPADQAQQAVKIPVICGFHKRVLLLTSQIQNQG